MLIKFGHLGSTTISSSSILSLLSPVATRHFLHVCYSSPWRPAERSFSFPCDARHSPVVSKSCSMSRPLEFTFSHENIHYATHLMKNMIVNMITKGQSKQSFAPLFPLSPPTYFPLNSSATKSQAVLKRRVQSFQTAFWENWCKYRFYPSGSNSDAYSFPGANKRNWQLKNPDRLPSSWP